MSLRKDCFTCAQELRGTALPPRERIAADDHWRVAHATGTALPGWLVLVPRRHVTAVWELTDAEAESLGSWQVRLSRALREVVGCPKTYVAQFAEAEGYAHVHFHVVPRDRELPEELRGPGVFGQLNRPAEEWVPDDRADLLAESLGLALSLDGLSAELLGADDPEGWEGPAGRDGSGRG
ncbi:HIT family protein [Streptomyces sp. LP05-1]|uniref:HIT family protein n=1 Tax=Streptomyces pyxinae TaxID=2970734 RepID=A0ABT2CLJ1_9ACTN|nr:HIT family protein [Streptomyces sp. LP05-1]MCS0638294.1 HIT family protein [Streptomyces sp. LP05-1]